MTKLIWSLMVLTLIGANTPVGLAQPKVESSTVFLHIVEGFGNPVYPTTVKIVNDAGDDVSPKIFEGVFRNLPYGEYELSVEATGFLTWKGKVYVDQARMRITVGLELGPAEGSVDRCRVSGELTGVGARPERGLWLRLLPLFGNEISEIDVMATGKFYSSGIPCGKYMVAVIGEQRIIKTVPLDLTKNTKPVSIQIGGK